MEREEKINALFSRLRETFSYRGMSSAERLLPLKAAEAKAGEVFTETLRGHRLLTDSFHVFYMSTLGTAQDFITANGWPIEKWYTVFCGHVVTQFVSIRAAEAAANGGYPVRAFGMQRGIMDDACMLAGVMSGETSLSRWHGVDGIAEDEVWTDVTHKSVRKKREAEERRVYGAIMGHLSGLSDDHRQALKRLNRTFDSEVHGARLSMVGKLRASQTPDDLFRFWPILDTNTATIYSQRCVEIGWMMLRVLPFLQPLPGCFGERWAKEWALLDEAFLYFVEGFGSLGRPLAPAIIAMMAAKFPFNTQTCYIER